MIDITVVTASHNRAILDANLARSPLIASGAAPLHVEHNALSAAAAYNRALDATKSEIVVFAHHDVYLPKGWETVLERRLAETSAIDRTGRSTAPSGWRWTPPTSVRSGPRR